MSDRIYLDNNAAARIDPQVADLIVQTLPKLQGNPSSVHYFGQATRALVSNARTSIAACLGVKSKEILFTSGGTESVNMAVRGLIHSKKTGHIITSAAEHACMIAVCRQLESQGYTVTYLPVGSWGSVLPEAVQAAIRPDTQLIALMSANNETGVKTDIRAIGALAHAQNIPFFVDAVASLGKDDLIIPQGVSAMAFSGHKIHALQGIGMLYLRSGTKFQSLIIGGEQEYGRRAGTENILGIVSMAKAIELISPDQMQTMRILRDQFEEILLKTGHVCVNGEGPRVSNVSNLAFLGIDGETLLLNLDRAGVAASHGSACSSGSLEPSRVLQAMGLPLDRVNSSIRFSFSRFTTAEEVIQACGIIKKCITSPLKC